MRNRSKFFILLFLAIFFLLLNLNTVKAENFSEKNPYKNDLVLVKFKRDANKIFDSFLYNFASSHNLTYQSEKNIVANNKKGYFLFSLDEETNIQNKIDELNKDAKVKRSQPSYMFSPAKKKSSSQDKYFNREWWVYNNGTIGTGGSDIYLMPVWQEEQKNWPSIVVGIIDSGINAKHSDLKKNVVKGYDFVHTRKKDTTDKDGHGSFIAGLIASQVNNKKGIAGLSRLNKLKVMPLKFDFSTDQAISAISYAQSRGVRILNASWGTEEFDQALYDAIKNYSGLVIAAAGNEGEEHKDSNHFYPCDFDLDNIICVGASDENDRMTDYSDYGSSVDLLAPGGSDGAPMISFDTKKNRYIDEIGTSFSTALVSGSAGLVLSANPSISNAEIKNLLLNNARKKEELAGKIFSGGLLNVRAAVNREIP